MARPLIPGARISTAKHTVTSPRQHPAYGEWQKKPYMQPKAICTNVPLPPQAYNDPREDLTPEYLSAADPRTSAGLHPRSRVQFTSSQKFESPQDEGNLRRKGSESSSSKKVPHCLVYPKAVIPNNYTFLYIGANEILFLPWEFYVNVPWHSYELSTRYLMEYAFDGEILATHNLHGKKHLDRVLLEDIVTHVSERCGVGEEYVVFTIARICAHYSKVLKELNEYVAPTENK